MSSSSEIEIRAAEQDPFLFFDRKVTDVTALDTDPWDEAWEAIIDGEVAGMLAVEFFGTPGLIRLAVKPDFREQGVGAALVEYAKTQREEWYAYVDEENTACKALLSSVGFEEGGWAPPPNLERWSWSTGEE